eukprot:jgi/Tetstr1/439553/TSEL_027982.t1
MEHFHASIIKDLPFNGAYKATEQTAKHGKVAPLFSVQAASESALSLQSCKEMPMLCVFHSSSTRPLPVFRGLRVRMGIHSGVANSTSNSKASDRRTRYGHQFMEIANAVSSLPCGGQIVMTADTLAQIESMNDLLARVDQQCQGWRSSLETNQALLFPSLSSAAMSILHLGRHVLLKPGLQAPQTRKDVTILFTFIENWTQLEALERSSASSVGVLSYCLELHDSLVRTLLLEHNGYGGRVARTAASCAPSRSPSTHGVQVALQEGLLHADWHPDVLTTPWACEQLTARAAAAEPRPAGRGNARRYQPSMRTGRMEYFGPIMNHARASQVRRTAARFWCTANCLSNTVANPQSLGQHRLKGITKEVQIFQSAVDDSASLREYEKFAARLMSTASSTTRPRARRTYEASAMRRRFDLLGTSRRAGCDHAKL